MRQCSWARTSGSSCVLVLIFFTAPRSGFAGELPIRVEDPGTDNGQGQIVYDLVMQEDTVDFVDGGPPVHRHKWLQRKLFGTDPAHDPRLRGHHSCRQSTLDRQHHTLAQLPYSNRDGRGPASTFWYHPHIMPENVQGGAQDPDGTSAQVYRGLAGLIIVDDDESLGLGLPLVYGVDDIPLIIQDREFDLVTGEFIEFPIVNNGQNVILRKGTTILANGEIDAVLTSYAQLIRFRILNGSNARLYNLGLSDNQPFWQIGSDGGLLEAPVQMTRLLLAPGERVEIVMDLSDDVGLGALRLMSFASELGTAYVPDILADDLDRTDFVILDIDVPNRTTAGALFTLPATMATVERILASEAHNEASPRPFVMGLAGGAGMSINGVLRDMEVINEVIQQIWQLDNPSQQSRPRQRVSDSDAQWSRATRRQ